MALDIESVTSVLKEGIPALEVLAGSKAVALFLEKISGAIGWYVEPKQIVRKARAEAAAGLIKAEAAQEEKTLEQRTAARIIYEETKQQRSIESIVFQAIPGINEGAEPNEIDDDWLTNFFDKCRHISNEEMQKLWAQILSGEVNKPGSFSKRTVNFLTTLTQHEAELFQKFTACVWNIGGRNQPILYMDDINGFIVLTDILDLQELNLITYMSDRRGLAVISDVIHVSYQEHKAIVQAKEAGKGINIGNVSFTQMGGELYKICSHTANMNYYSNALKRWRSSGYAISEV